MKDSINESTDLVSLIDIITNAVVDAIEHVVDDVVEEDEDEEIYDYDDEYEPTICITNSVISNCTFNFGCQSDTNICPVNINSRRHTNNGSITISHPIETVASSQHSSAYDDDYDDAVHKARMNFFRANSP